jgi:hypothetical protein
MAAGVGQSPGNVPQHEDFSRPQAADGQNPQDQVFSRRCLREQGTKLINAQKRSHDFFSDVRHDELPRRILLDYIFIHRIFEASSGVRVNFSDGVFAVPILRHFVKEQL